MKTRFFMKLCLFSLLVWCVSSCKSDNGDSVRPIALECMYTHLTDMTNMLDTAKIGTSDGTFPLANAQNLQKAVEELQTGISKGMAGYFVLQYEIDNYCIAAEKAIAEFQDSYQQTLQPGTPAELDVKNDAGVLQNYMPNTRNQNMWAFQEPTDNSRCMTGFIKKFRMWSTAKSANEVKTLMNSDVTGTESGLVCAWDFTTVAEDVTNIPDKTGKHVAKIVGNYKWFKVEN